MAPVDFFDKLLSFYYGKTADREKPVIQASSAALLSVCYVFVYVVPFYLSAKTRPSPQLSRDAPAVIRARIRAVALASTVTGAVTSYVALSHAHLDLAGVLRVLGVWPVDLLDVLRSSLLVAILFLGPLFEAAFAEGRWRSWLSGRAFRETFSHSIGWRNYVAGPLSEELVFRSHILPLHLFAKQAPTTLVFLTPLYFGLAHFHHFYEFKLTHPHMPLLPSVMRSVFQLAYTTVFGWLAAFLFLRTGSVLPPILAHAFCNWMGLPRLWGRVEGPVTSIGPQAADASKHDTEAATPTLGESPASHGRLGLPWTLLYYVLLVTGAVLFFVNLWTLTESPHALVSFSEHAAAQVASKPIKEGPWSKWNVGGFEDAPVAKWSVGNLGKAVKGKAKGGF